MANRRTSNENEYNPMDGKETQWRPLKYELAIQDIQSWRKIKGPHRNCKGFPMRFRGSLKGSPLTPRGFPVQSFVVNSRVTLMVCNGRLAGSQDLQTNSIWLLMSVKGLLMNMLDSLMKTIIDKLLKIQWKTGQGMWSHLRIWKTWEIHWRTVWNWMETQRMDFCAKSTKLMSSSWTSITLVGDQGITLKFQKENLWKTIDIL